MVRRAKHTHTHTMPVKLRPEVQHIEMTILCDLFGDTRYFFLQYQLQKRAHAPHSVVRQMHCTTPPKAIFSSLSLSCCRAVIGFCFLTANFCDAVVCSVLCCSLDFYVSISRYLYLCCLFFLFRHPLAGDTYEH